MKSTKTDIRKGGFILFLLLALLVYSYPPLVPPCHSKQKQSLACCAGESEGMPVCSFDTSLPRSSDEHCQRCTVTQSKHAATTSTEERGVRQHAPVCMIRSNSADVNGTIHKYPRYNSFNDQPLCLFVMQQWPSVKITC